MEIVGHKFDGYRRPPATNGRMIGIEYEIENASHPYALQDPQSTTRHPVDSAKMWAAISDNSLRNHGAEFVSFPFGINKLGAAMDSLFDEMYKPSWKSSVRTGIHVHVDARDYTMEHIKALMATYALLEPALFDFVGQEREECIYCVPWYRASDDLEHAAKLFYRGFNLYDTLNEIHRSWTKYNAMNFAPLFRIGTVEFRHAPTWTTKTPVMKWANLCERIVTFAHKETAESVLDRYEISPVHFVEDASGGYLSVTNKYEKRLTALGSDVLATKLLKQEIPLDHGWIRADDLEWKPREKPPKPIPGQAGYDASLASILYGSGSLGASGPKPKKKKPPQPQVIQWGVNPFAAQSIEQLEAMAHAQVAPQSPQQPAYQLPDWIENYDLNEVEH